MTPELTTLLEQYETALYRAAATKDDLDAAISQAYLSGAIDGKNAETREAQLFGIVCGKRTESTYAEIRVKVLEARIGLEKALLYSMCGK